jgi:hypothetical protein
MCVDLILIYTSCPIKRYLYLKQFLSQAFVSLYFSGVVMQDAMTHLYGIIVDYMFLLFLNLLVGGYLSYFNVSYCYFLKKENCSLLQVSFSSHLLIFSSCGVTILFFLIST